MRHIINFITYTLIVIITGILVRLIFSEDLLEWLLDPSLWEAALILAVIGLLIETGIVYLFRKRVNKDKIRLYSKYIIGGFLLFFILYNRYEEFRHEQNFGNIEHNEYYFKYFADNYKTEKKIAFDELMLKYPCKNDIRITGSSIDVRDTTIEGNTRFIYDVIFSYEKKKEDLRFIAQISVVNESATILEYDRPMNEFERYSADSLKSEVLKSLKEAIDAMPDSMANKLKKDLKDVIQ